ncbi:MAG: sensor histidine kinase [Candidatus Thiodiazotropha sp.]
MKTNPTALTQLRPLFIFGIPLLCWLSLLQLHKSLPNDEFLVITSGLRLISHSTSLPDSNYKGWIAVNLSDDWWRTLPHEKEAWYRFEIDLAVAPDRLWGIYLPRAAVNAAAWLNGEMIGSGGQMTSPISINWNRPLYLRIPNGLLHPGRNELQIHLVSDLEGYGLLRPFYLGSDRLLAPYFQLRYFLDVTSVEVISVFMVTMSGFMGALWWLRRDSVYGWFAFSIIIWALHNLSLLITNPSIPTAIWWWFWYISVGWAVVGTVFFVSRFLNVIRPSIEHSVLISAGIGSLILAFSASNGYWLRWIGAHLWHSLILIFGAYSTYIVLHAWRRHQHDKELSWLIMSGLLVFSFGIHDWLVTNQWITRIDGLYIQYSAPLVLLVFGWILLMRFVDTLTFAEHLNRNLESRVAEQVAAAEVQHKKIRQLEQQQILAEERSRLMRDMHDGIGGHLISTISLIEGANPSLKEVRKALQVALDDLRLVVNSMDPSIEELETAMFDLRYRLNPRLKATGVEAVWQLDDLQDLAKLGPEYTLQILRIVQEAVTNILKHAQASKVMISATTLNSNLPDSQLKLVIHDNGQGFKMPHGPGKGLVNMQRRAESIGGRVEINSTANGTAVELALPLSKLDVDNTETSV